MEIAVNHFDNKRYLKASEVADEILSLVPKFRPAQELKEDADRADINAAYARFLDLRRERWKGVMEDIDESMVPYAEHRKVRFPSEDEWQKVVQRSKQIGLAQQHDRRGRGSSGDQEQARDDESTSISRIRRSTTSSTSSRSSRRSTS